MLYEVITGERAKEVIASVLPVLGTAARSGESREEASYMLVSLGIMMNDPAARSKAADFLREFPSSPYAGRIVITSYSIHYTKLYENKWKQLCGCNWEPRCRIGDRC